MTIRNMAYIGILALAAGLLAACMDWAPAETPTPAPHPPGSASASNIMLPPRDVQEFVDRGVLVFIGTINGPGTIKDEGPFDDEGNLEEDSLEFPFVRYDLEVVEFIAGERVDNPELRLFAFPSAPEIDLSKTYLFSLLENPDGSYGRAAGYGMIDITSDVPKGSDGEASAYVEGLTGSSTSRFWMQ